MDAIKSRIALLVRAILESGVGFTISWNVGAIDLFFL